MLRTVRRREALRQAENGVGPLAADLADLQHQLAHLMQQPFAFPADSTGHASSRRSSRPASAIGAPTAAAGATAELEPQSPLAGGEVAEPVGSAGVALQVIAGSRHGSPRIRAVHSRAEQQAAEGARGAESGNRGDSGAAQRPPLQALVSSVHVHCVASARCCDV